MERRRYTKLSSLSEDEKKIHLYNLRKATWQRTAARKKAQKLGLPIDPKRTEKK